MNAGIVNKPDALVQIDEDIARRIFTGGIERKAVDEQMRLSDEQKLARNVLNAISIIA